MKRTVAIAAGVVALVVAAYTGSRLSARPSPMAPGRGAPGRDGAPAATRVVLINLRFVIKKYKKYMAFIEEVKRDDQKYVGQLNAKQAERDKLQAQLEKESGGAKRDRLKAEAGKLQRAMEEFAAKVRADLTRRGNEEMVAVYKEIRDASARHAKANNIDLVLHFEGPGDAKEIDSPLSIQKHFNGGGCCPMYWKPSVDISDDIAKALNDAYDRRPPAKMPPKMPPG